MRYVVALAMMFCSSAFAQSAADRVFSLNAKGMQYVDLCVLIGQNHILKIRNNGVSDNAIGECIVNGKSMVAVDHAKVKESFSGKPEQLRLLKEWYIEWQSMLEATEPSSTENEFRYTQRINDAIRQFAKVSKKVQMSLDD